MKTLTQMVLSKTSEEFAQEVGVVKKPILLEKLASKESPVREFLSGVLEEGVDPDELEKTASAVDRVLGVLENLRPDLEVEDLLSLEGRRKLDGRHVQTLDGSPLEKTASKKLSLEIRERIAARLMGGGK